MSMQWNHQAAIVNGVRIHYVLHGEGPPVMLVHGWPEMWYSWRKQIPVLSQRFQVIVPDLRGFGYSDKPFSGYDARTAATDLYELAKSLGHQRVALVGHDIGVRISYRYALDHENEVERLTIIDSPPPYQTLQPQAPDTIRERWHSFFHQVPDLPEILVGSNIEAYLRHFYRDWSINTNLFSDEEVAVYVKGYSQPGALRGGFGYYRSAAMEDVPQWEADANRKLNMPALVLWGDRRTRFWTSVGSNPFEAWKEYLTNARGKHIPGGGHFLHEEKPEEVNEALLAFLSEK